MHRRAMTFVEIMVATGIIVTCCLVVLGLLPAALRTQQMGRYRIYAAASAVSLMEAFSHPPMPPAMASAGYGGFYNVYNSPFKPNEPPRPGWASHLRVRGCMGSAAAPDLEQAMSRAGGPLIPVPLEIARRLDSDDNEIGRLLDAGGALFYLDPGQFRGNSQIAASTDASALAGLPDEFQQLVCAVVSPAQQNALPAAPYDVGGPPVQTYPFPPLWQWWSSWTATAAAWKANTAYDLGACVSNDGGKIFRCIVAGTSAGSGGPTGTAADISDNTVHWAYTTLTRTPVRVSTVSEAWNSPTLPTTASFTDAGDPSTGLGSYAASRGTANGGISWVNTGSATLPSDASQPIGQYHGCVWKYQVDVETGRGNTASPWLAGWWAFKRLAGDEWAGWMPVLFDLEAGGTPPTYEQLVNYRDRALFLWMRVMPPSLRSGFPAPVVYAQDAAQCASLVANLGLGSMLGPVVSYPATTADANGKTIAVKAGSQSTASGYLNLNVKAHGLENYAAASDLWSWSSDVDPSSPYQLAEFRWVEPKDYASEAGKSRLQAFRFADPYALPASEFPPHPAQVLALSYLAHASLLVAGAAQTGQFDGYRCYAVTPGTFDPRVTDADRVFARKVCEMSLRWAVAYANERPADYGAPRPENRAVMNDRPVQIFDLWFDNVRRSTAGPAFAPVAGAAGSAVRQPQVNMGTYSVNPGSFTGWDRAAPFESFYRWIEPPNPNLPRGSAGQLPHVRSGVGPVGFPWDNMFRHWQQYCDPDPATRNASVGSPWPNWLSEPTPGNDIAHAWIDRPFLAQDRARELVYWAVDWKSYEDAEEAPSYPVDFGRTGRLVEMGYPTHFANDPTVNIGNWLTTGGQESDFTGQVVKTNAWGGSESVYCWTDETRQQSYVRSQVASGSSAPTVFSQAWIHLGAFGADRNMNGVFDRGPIPRTTRLRAQLVARFSYYDPVVGLDLGGR